MDFETICYEIAHVSQREIKRIKQIAKEQSEYCSPLKMGTASKQHKLGEHNRKVIEKFLELKEILTEKI